MTDSNRMQWDLLSQAFAFLGNSLLAPVRQLDQAGLTEEFWEAFPTFGDDGTAKACASLAALCAGLEERAVYDPVTDVSVEYTHLFVGPPKPSAAPWETMYRGGERVDYGFGRVIVVADRGLNTSDNIFYLNGNNTEDYNPRDGYVYGQSVRGADEEFKAWVLDQKDYVDTPIDPSPENAEADDTEVRNHSEIIFRHKSRVQKRKLRISREFNDGHIGKTTILVDQKQMVYYSAKYAAKQKLERDRAVERAKDLIAHPKKYDRMTAKG